jgi:hypothetical protein
MWCGQERNIAQYSHWIWYTCETNTLFKMCLNETYIKVHMVKILSDAFPIQNG